MDSKKRSATKWAVYGGVLLAVLAVQTIFFNRIRVFGVSPILIPVLIAVVGTFEGPEGGIGFGLISGVIFDAVFSNTPGLYILVFTIVGGATGIITDYMFSKNFYTCLFFSFAALFFMSLIQLARVLLSGDGYPGMLIVAGIEIVYSLLFCVPIYFLVRWVYGFVGEL